jgi:hypothetical protein
VKKKVTKKKSDWTTRLLRRDRSAGPKKLKVPVLDDRPWPAGVDNFTILERANFSPIHLVQGDTLSVTWDERVAIPKPKPSYLSWHLPTFLQRVRAYLVNETLPTSVVHETVLCKYEIDGTTAMAINEAILFSGTFEGRRVLGGMVVASPSKFLVGKNIY